MSAVNDISADVVSECGPPDTCSSAVQLFAVDEEPNAGPRQASDLLYRTGKLSHASSPQFVCEQIDHDEDDDGDEEDEESLCSGIGGPGSHRRPVLDLPLGRK